MTTLTREELIKHVAYNPITGIFIRLKAPQKKFVGVEAGWKYNGYRYIKINRVSYKAHRLAFLYMLGRFPEHHVDHINGTRDDNRWANLREASDKDNAMNQGLYKNNTSGVMGVKYKKSSSRWEVYVGNSPRVYVGSSKNWFEAVCLRKSAEAKMGYSRSHGRQNIYANTQETAKA